MNRTELEIRGYEIVKKDNDKHTYIKTFCSQCNKEMVVRSDYVDKHSGICISCQKKSNTYATKHGACADYKHKRLYNIWIGLKHRRYKTYNPSVCEEWNDYSAFEQWALSHGYSDELTIDRINNRKDYEPTNCRWISLSNNARYARSHFTRGQKLLIYALRKHLGLTQKEASSQLNVSRHCIQDLEREVKSVFK